jgi:hypothetical protein
MQILKAGVFYFAIVFGAGFIIGTVRVLWVVPSIGTRMAELMEAPIMLVATILAARWVIRRFEVPPTTAKRLIVGFTALGLLLVAELSLVVGFRGLAIGQYLAERDPVSGTVYLVMLGMFASMPLLLARN